MKPLYFIFAIVLATLLFGMSLKASEKTPAPAAIPAFKKQINFAESAAALMADESAKSADDLENVDIWWMEVAFKTCDVKKAGTDGAVYVQFNSAGGKFYLDNPGDDRERGDLNRYTVMYLGRDQRPFKIRDLQYFKVGIEGSDGWCISQADLYVNMVDQPLFSRKIIGGDLLSRSTGELWLDDSGTMTFPHRELRQNQSWLAAKTNVTAFKKVPASFTKDQVTSLLAGFVGHSIAHTSLNWRNDHAVTLAQKSDNTLRAKLELEKSISYSPNIGADVVFDIAFTCADPGILEVEIRNKDVKVRLPKLLNVVAPGISDMLANFLVGLTDTLKITHILQAPSATLNAAVPLCVPIVVDAGANVRVGG